MHHCSVSFLTLTCWIRVVSGSGDHGGPELLALYSMNVGGSYTLQLEAVSEDDSVEFMVVPTSSADLEGLEVAQEESAPCEFESKSSSACRKDIKLFTKMILLLPTKYGRPGRGVLGTAARCRFSNNAAHPFASIELMVGTALVGLLGLA